jgi:hypothetical protein
MTALRSFASPRLLVAVVAFALPGVAGCTLEPGKDGLEVVPRAPYGSSPVVIDEQAWNGEAVVVDVERGNIEIVGRPEAKTIKVQADTLTWAQKQKDASDMRAATIATARLERDASGAWSVKCEIPKGDFGSALPEATQCNVRIEVPAPEGVVHDVHAIAHFGDVYMNRLQSGPSTRIVASGIEVEGLVLRGNVQIYSYYADVEVEPRASGDVLVTSASEDWYYLPTLEEVEKRDKDDGAARFGATLRIPRDFTSRVVSLSSRGAAVEAFGFPDISSGAPRGPVGPLSAHSVTVTANQGNATLLVWGESVTTARGGDFATDARLPWTTPQR